MFTDNDELAGMISGMIFADTLIILSNVDGVYDKNGKVIPQFRPDEDMPGHIVPSGKSMFGKGGMQNKFGVAKMVAIKGTEVFIANSKEKEVLQRILNGESVGTRFIPTTS